MSELNHLFETYRAAVLDKDEKAFLNLYHPEFMGFDMWEEWVKIVRFTAVASPTKALLRRT